MSKIILEYAPEHLMDLESIAGADEVGRGCGAGPMVTAAVILPKGFKSPLLRDSKKLNEKKRVEAYALIKENALCIAYSFISPQRIDEIGLTLATNECFEETFRKLSLTPDCILLDGNVWTGKADHNVELVVKGDDTYLSIAAASIVAKYIRDNHMTTLAIEDNRYDFKNNKGYLTPKHIAAIKELGPTEHHRKTFIKNIKINLDSAK